MTERAVVDSTVLIYLARIDRLELLDALFEDVQVPEPVYTETVVRGRQEGYRDAIAIERAVEGVLVRSSLEEPLEARAEEIATVANLGSGEAGAVALAQQSSARCLTDDHAARTTAEAMGLAVGGTIYVLLRGLERGALTIDDYVAALDDLTDEGFRMDASLYRQARSAGRSIEE